MVVIAFGVRGVHSFRRLLKPHALECPRGQLLDFRPRSVPNVFSSFTVLADFLSIVYFVTPRGFHLLVDFFPLFCFPLSWGLVTV